MKQLYNDNKIFRIITKILTVIIILAILIILFLNFWPSLGGNINQNDKKEYEKRALNYIDGKFQNEKEINLKYKKTENVYMSKKDAKPKEKLKIETPEFLENPSEEDLTITWLGHASTLIEISKMKVLIDPMFSSYSSPLQFIGPKRFSDSPLEIEDLPNIDIVIITHDHYDHLDYNTIKKIKNKVDKFIVPLGVEKHLEKWGIDKNKIISMVWWEEIQINKLTVVCTPSQHYSNRSIDDKNNTLWASFILKNDNYQIYQSGDTGYAEHFKKIYQKYGEFDLVLLDTGQYNNSWKEVHMNPEESVNSALDLHAKVAMPIHWGTFNLASHPWDDPGVRFTKEAKEKSLISITPLIGQTVNYKNYNDYIYNNWWDAI